MVGKRDKELARIRNNPKDVRFEVIKRILESNGFKMATSHSGTSHYHFKHPLLRDHVTIPKGRPIKAVYIINAIKGLDEVLELGEAGRDE